MPSASITAQKLKSRKRLIVGCDGSWQASDVATGNVTSNVTNMCRAIAQEAILEDGEAIQQVVYYQPGVGTHYMMAGPSQLGSVAAGELSQNVVEAYNFISANYEQGDQIYLFGFSRGAFTARALNGLICSVGILRKAYMARFPEIFAKYRHNETVEECALAIDADALQNYQDIYGTTEGYDGIHEAFGNETPRLMKQYGGEDPFKVEVEVVGVWDTVGALGWPATWLDMYIGSGFRKWYNSGYRYLNTSLSDRVNHAFHALALDEHRRPFSPTLWHKPKTNVDTELIQCWFAGVHINIGGGTASTKGDLGQMADLTFAWMVDLCKPYLAFDQKFLDRFAATHHITAKTLQERAADANPSIKIDQSLPAWADPTVGSLVDGFRSTPFYGSLTRSPGEYNLNNELAEVGSPDWVQKWENYVTNEYIHPSARVRLEKTQKFWKPEGRETPWSSPVEQRALRHFTFGKQNSVGTDFSDPGKAERGLTRPGSGYVWSKTSPQNSVCLLISEWAVASPEFRKLNPNTKSFEQQLLMEVEHETSRIEVNRYQGVWADMASPSHALQLPPAKDSKVYDKLAAGGTILWLTTTLIAHSLFDLVAAGPKAIINKISGPDKKKVPAAY